MRQLMKIVALVAGSFLAAKQTLLSAEQPEDNDKAIEHNKQIKKTGLKLFIMRVVALLGLFGIMGFIIAASGIIPMKASDGHWAITKWFLEFSKNRSIDTHSSTIEVPSLDEPELVLKGAGHYAIGCFPCHGSPETRHPRIAQAMTPAPPYLWPEFVKREPEELFYIIKNGLKFTGMPAWPTQKRDDEVWAIVAFLRKYSDIDSGEYQRLVDDDQVSRDAVPLTGLTGPQHVPKRVLENCARCHGADGNGKGVGAFPRLAGQSREYLFSSLEAFARRERHSGIMEPVVTGLSSEEMSAIAQYYSSLPTASLPATSNMLSAIERGKTIAQQGIPSQRIPACAACHGPGDTNRNPLYPKLANQYSSYITLQLMIFKKGERDGTAYAQVMRQIADRLTTEHMRDVALYYESLVDAPDTKPQ